MRLTYKVRLLPRRDKDGKNRRMRIMPPTKTLDGIKVPAKPYERTTGVEDDAEAQAVADAMERKLNAGLAAQVNGSATVDSTPTVEAGMLAWLEWADAMSGIELAERTVHQYAMLVKRVTRCSLASKRVGEVQAEDFDELRRELLRLPCNGRGRKGTLKPATVFQSLLVFSSYWRWQADQPNMPKLAEYGSPWKKIKKAKAKTRKRAYTEGELEQVLEWFAWKAPKHYPMVLLLADSGLRIGEACALRWEHLNVNERVLNLYETKSDEPREVSVSWRSLAALLKPRNGIAPTSGWVFPRATDQSKPVGNYVLHYSLKRACSDLGIAFSQVDTHSFRRAWVRRAFDSGQSMAVVQKQVGHARYETTWRYADGVSLVAKHAAVDALAGSPHELVGNPVGEAANSMQRKGCGSGSGTPRETVQAEPAQADTQDGPHQQISGGLHGMATLHELTDALARVVELAEGQPELWAVVQSTIQQHSPGVARSHRQA